MLYPRIVAYRDDLASAQERAERLALDLEDERRRIAELERAVSSRDAQLDTLRRRFNGMPAATRVRFGLIVTVALVFGVLIGALFDFPNAPARAAVPHVRTPDTSHPGIAVADGDESDAEPSAPCDCAPADLDCNNLCSAPSASNDSEMAQTTASPKFDSGANKYRLSNLVASGRATKSEIRQLKALCMLDGDRVCRAMAVDALKALEVRDP